MSGKTWQEELTSLVEDTGIVYPVEVDGEMVPVERDREEEEEVVVDGGVEEELEESLREQVEGFVKAWGELVLELGKGCVEIVNQNLVTEECYVVRKCWKPLGKALRKLKFLNEFLPEDKDPAFAWPVVLLVFLLAFPALNVNTPLDYSVSQVRRVLIHPPSACRVSLPDGRYLAYHERGVPVKQARYSLVVPHAFLSSRLAGIPGVRDSLLEEFGIHLLTYDLPGFGESDPHPSRNLNSSALDMLHLTNAVGVVDKFWVLGFSSGSMHAWAALKYIPDRIAGVAFIAPFVNPYDASMTRKERSQVWKPWVWRRKLMYILARRSPKLLWYFYRRTFLSGKHGHITKWLPFSPGKKDQDLINNPVFEEFWYRDVEESVRQGSAKPFIEEAILQVSDWGFKHSDLQFIQHDQESSIFRWLKSMFCQTERKSTSFQGPAFIWQGTDDRVVPVTMLNHILRGMTRLHVQVLPDEGHFSYYFFCDECHKQIFSTLFGAPQGALYMEGKEKTLEGEYLKESLPALSSSLS